MKYPGQVTMRWCRCMKQLLIDSQGKAIRTALLADGKLVEIFIDRKDGGSWVGHIVNGVVKNILPSGFAFIDIGQEKNAFLNLRTGHSIKQGQYIPVQVRKDATGDKGASLSEVLKIKGRRVIIYPDPAREIGVSSKITGYAERKRLHNIAARLLPAGYSCILRTQSANLPEEVLSEEFRQLTAECANIAETAKYSPALKILYRDNFMLNDLLTDDIDEVIINDEAMFNEKNEKNEKNGKHKILENKIVKLWESENKLFDAFNVERQISEALHRNMWLPCGGFITFDYVEACVIIDVNTGKFSGKKDYRNTVLKVNLEAAHCIAGQIALRNLSGMIIIDFIDMPDEQDKNTLLAALGQELKKGRIPADIIGMTKLGLVQLTRRKQREPLHKLLQIPCPHCNGTGRRTPCT